MAKEIPTVPIPMARGYAPVDLSDFKLMLVDEPTVKVLPDRFTGEMRVVAIPGTNIPVYRVVLVGRPNHRRPSGARPRWEELVITVTQKPSEDIEVGSIVELVNSQVSIHDFYALGDRQRVRLYRADAVTSLS